MDGSYQCDDGKYDLFLELRSTWSESVLLIMNPEML